MGKIEQKYIETLIKEGLSATIFLTCNIRLTGVIKGIDDNGVLIDYEGRLQFIYKHAISSISAGTALKGKEFDK